MLLQAVACNDATITMYRMAFNVVHGLYKDRYACRENMTDVVVHNLTTDEKGLLLINIATDVLLIDINYFILTHNVTCDYSENKVP